MFKISLTREKRLFTALALAISCHVGAQQAHPTRWVVKSGDSFASLVVKAGGNARQWALYYDPLESKLANPSIIQIGMTFELRTVANRKLLVLTSNSSPAAEPASVRAEAITPGVPPSVAAPTFSGPVFRVGVIPNISATTIQTNYTPLKRHFEQAWGKPVQILTAPDFKQFHARAKAGQFDLIITAPNLARLGQLDDGFKPLMVFQPKIRGLLVTTFDYGAFKPGDLAGSKLAMANPQSLVALVGKQWLLDKFGLDETKYQIVKASNEENLGQLLMTGEARAAMMSNGEFRQFPEQYRLRMKIVDVFTEFSNFVLMAPPSLAESDVTAIRQGLLQLAASANGHEFLSRTGYSRIADFIENDLKILDAFIPGTRRAMAD